MFCSLKEVRRNHVDREKDGKFVVICVISILIGILFLSLYIVFSFNFVLCVIVLYCSFIVYTISMYVMCKFYLSWVILVCNFVGSSMIFIFVLLIFVFDVNNSFL